MNILLRLLFLQLFYWSREPFDIYKWNNLTIFFVAESLAESLFFIPFNYLLVLQVQKIQHDTAKYRGLFESIKKMFA